jgi:hypothetical protein
LIDQQSGIPVEIGGNTSLKAGRHEAAALALETHQALFTWLDRRAQPSLESYVLDHYREWLKHQKFSGLAVEDIVLVLGTYKTKNWNATACSTDSEDFSILAEGHIRVPHLVDVQGRVEWNISQQSTPGYNCGHLHNDTIIDNRNDLNYFRNCGRVGCSPPQTQSIFLRTFRVREVKRLWRLAVVEITVQGESALGKHKFVVLPKNTPAIGLTGAVPSSIGGNPVQSSQVENFQFVDSDCVSLSIKVLAYLFFFFFFLVVRWPVATNNWLAHLVGKGWNIISEGVVSTTQRDTLRTP